MKYLLLCLLLPTLANSQAFDFSISKVDGVTLNLSWEQDTTATVYAVAYGRWTGLGFYVSTSTIVPGNSTGRDILVTNSNSPHIVIVTKNYTGGIYVRTTKYWRKRWIPQLQTYLNLPN